MKASQSRHKMATVTLTFIPQIKISKITVCGCVLLKRKDILFKTCKMYANEYIIHYKNKSHFPLFMWLATKQM